MMMYRLAVILLTVCALAGLSPSPTRMRSPAGAYVAPTYAEDDYSEAAVFDRMHRGPKYRGPFSPIVLTNFSVYEYWGDDQGKEFFTRNVVQTGPRTFAFNLKSMGQGPNEVRRADLLERDRQVTQLMTEVGPNPITPEQKRELDAINEQIESERTVYVEFNRWREDFKDELVTHLKLVKGDMPIRRGPNHEVLEHKPAPLPWMLDPAFKELASRVRRGPGKEEHIYEFSRGSNVDDPELFRYSFAFLLRQAIRDVLEEGGDIRNAYIYGHTIKQETTDHFTRNFPWKQWEEAKPYLPKGHMMFRSSIADILGSSDLHEYFDDLKQEVAELCPGDPVRLFLFKAEAAGKHEAFLRMTGADGRFHAYARITYPKDLIDLRIQVAAAKHGIPIDRLRRQIEDRSGYQFQFDYYGWSGDAPIDEVRIELAPPTRITGAEGLYSYSRRKFDLRKVDLFEARRLVIKEYVKLLDQWQSMGRKVSELGYPTREAYLAKVKAYGVQVDYQHRLIDRDSEGYWMEPQVGKIKRELKKVRPLRNSEFRLESIRRVGK